MKYAFVLLILAFACSPAKRIARICRKHPEACVSVRDSVIVRDTVVYNAVETDTIFSQEQHDTVFITKDKLQIKYKCIPQTKQVYIAGECEGDTVYLEKKVACPPLTAPVVKEKRKGMNWWALIAAAVTFCLGFRLARK